MAEWLAENIVTAQTMEEADAVATYFAERSWGVNPRQRALILGKKAGMARAKMALFLARFCHPGIGRLGVPWIDGKAGK
jgi:hypothetical protein